jgi:hypothetical protein
LLGPASIASTVLQAAVDDGDAQQRGAAPQPRKVNIQVI